MFKSIFRKNISISLFAIIPLNLNLWTPIAFPDIPSTEFLYDEKENVLNISSNKSASGYFYLFDVSKSLDKKKISWDWKVQRFPTVKRYFPFDKKNDDYALRIGFLIDDGKTIMPLPSQLKTIIDEKKSRVSFINFYLAVPEVNLDNKCDKFPFDSNMNYCLKFAGPQFTSISLSNELLIKTGVIPQQHKLVGFWIFADSDNTKTSSMAFIKNLRVED